MFLPTPPPPPPDAALAVLATPADDAFSFEVKERVSVGGCTGLVCRLVSQRWRGREWTHWLTLLVPDAFAARGDVEPPRSAVLLVTGGSNGSPPPDPASGEARFLASLAASIPAVVCVLQQVPNQPLLDGLSEDELIAETFDEFLCGETDEEGVLLVPMVRAARRAMDAAAEVARHELGRRLERFVVTGASKRGWTSYLTAAADDRVVATAPMVFDVLDMPAQLAHQVRCYGGPSEKLRPYTRRRIPERMETERGRALVGLVDPFSHRERLAVPKLLLLGTNDPYWTIDAATLYFRELPGPKHLFYLAGAGHGLGAGIGPTLREFLRRSLAGERLPDLDSRLEDDGRSLVVRWRARAVAARLWSAERPDRDFRPAEWTERPLPARSPLSVDLEVPEEGFRASFVEVTFAGPDGPFSLSTLPVVLPHEPR